MFIDEFRTIFFINFSKAILDTFFSAFCFANDGSLFISRISKFLINQISSHSFA